MLEKIGQYYIDQETVISVGRFSILWAMMEEKYFSKCCTTKKLAQVEFIKKIDVMTQKADDIKDAINEYFDTYDDRRNVLLFRSRDRFRERVKEYFGEKEIEPKEKAFAGLCTCFRVRNNLLHGEKAFNTLGDQERIIDRCSEFLLELLLEEVFRLIDN